MPRRSILLFAGFCVMVAAALAFVSFFVVNSRERASETGFVETGTGTAQIGGPFQLVDQDGRTVDQTLLNGKWSLVFFGFTYCPDFCPTTLASIEATERLLGDKADDLQTIFITVDPERDTPEVLNNYLNSEGFPEGVIGLTGTPEQIDGAAKAYRAIYEKVGEGDAYTMNHSLTVYLMGPDGQFRSAISHDLGPQRSAELIERVMARG